MYKINLTFTNPITGDSISEIFQFDPATLTVAKWTAAFPTVQTALTTLQTTSGPKEPAVW